MFDHAYREQVERTYIILCEDSFRPKCRGSQTHSVLTPVRAGAMALKLHVAGISVLKVTPKVGFVGDTALVDC